MADLPGADPGKHLVTITDPGPHDVDALRLLSLVRKRRHLRALWQFCFLLIPGGALVVWAANDWLPGSSNLRRALAHHLLVGELLAVAAFGIVLAVLYGLRYVPGGGRAAAALVPVRSGGGEPMVRAGHEDAQGLIPILRRKPLVSFGFALATFVLGTVAFAGWVQCAGGWNAAHGHGRIITIGSDSWVSGEYRNRSDSGYYLSSPFGTLTAQTSEKPEDGQRWAVSGERAYLIGGHGYWHDALFAGFFTFIAGLAAAGSVSYSREELARRKAAGEAPLEDSVAALRAGHRVVIDTLAAARKFTIGLPGPGQPYGTGLVAPEDVPPLPDTVSPEMKKWVDDWLEKDRREHPGLYEPGGIDGSDDLEEPAPVRSATAAHAPGLSTPAPMMSEPDSTEDETPPRGLREKYRRPALAGGAVLSVAAVATFVTHLAHRNDSAASTTSYQAGAVTGDHDVPLAYLTGTAWQSRVVVLDHSLATYSVAQTLHAAKLPTTTVGVGWTMVTQTADNDDDNWHQEAFVDLVDIGSMPCQNVIPVLLADSVRSARSAPHDELTALPTGWRAVRGRSAEDKPAVNFFGCEAGTILSATVYDSQSSDDPAAVALQLIDRLAKRGLVNFRNDTGVPSNLAKATTAAPTPGM